MSAPPGAYPEGASAPLTDEAQEILWLLGEDAPRYMVEVGAHDGVTPVSYTHLTLPTIYSV